MDDPTLSGRSGTRSGEEEGEEEEENKDPVAFSMPSPRSSGRGSAEGEEAEEDDEDLENRTGLVRNPPVVPRLKNHEQLQLAMLVNDRPCPCYYVSPAAVEAHQLPAQPGWYIEVPDEDVAFTVRVGVKLPEGMNFPVTMHLIVDGAIARKVTQSVEQVDIKGFDYGSDEAGMRLIQPFKLSKATLKLESDDDDSEEEEENPPTTDKKKVGTIQMKVFKAVYSGPSTTSSLAAERFIKQAVPQDKKTSFGIERSTEAGPVEAAGRLIISHYHRGEPLWEFQVFYRTRKFFETLQCRIDPRGAKRSGDAAAGGDTETVDRAANSEHLNKRIKRESELDTPLQSNASIDTFITRLAEKEETSLDLLKPILVELSKRRCSAVDDLQRLRREDWEDMLRACKLPISLARTSMKLCSAPLRADSIIILD